MIGMGNIEYCIEHFKKYCKIKENDKNLYTQIKVLQKNKKQQFQQDNNQSYQTISIQKLSKTSGVMSEEMNLLENSSQHGLTLHNANSQSNQLIKGIQS